MGIFEHRLRPSLTGNGRAIQELFRVFDDKLVPPSFQPPAFRWIQFAAAANDATILLGAIAGAGQGAPEQALVFLDAESKNLTDP